MQNTVVVIPDRKSVYEAFAGTWDRERGLRILGLVIACLILLVTLILPLYALLSRSVMSEEGLFIGVDNFIQYFSTPSLLRSFGHSLYVAVCSTVIVITLSFGFAWVLTRTRLPGRNLLKTIAMLPVLAPSLLPAISLVYLFGNQGVLNSWLMGGSIYGPTGIIIGSVFWTFPHALMILTTALETGDARLYESSRALGAGRLRTFFTVTLPSVKYGLFSASFVVFTLVITDFGVAKVIGGQYSVLATDIYKQVIGQQNFSMGAVVGVLMLLPVLLAFAGDRYVQRRQHAQLTSRSVPLEPQSGPLTNLLAVLFSLPVVVMILGMIGMSVYASLVTFWPYNMELSLNNYQFDLMDGGGWDAYRNSLLMAGLTAVFGTVLVFVNAYLVEKSRGLTVLRTINQVMAMIPLAVPGMVLGLGYIFFFNHPDNPLNGLYGTMTILVICSIVHFFTVCHLTATTALKQIDAEFELVSASLKVPFYRTFLRVTLPVCLPAVLDISMYLFVNAMTTVSAVVFLYGPDTMLASVAVMNMDDAGDIAPAAAMAVMIMLTSLAVKALHWLFSRKLLLQTQSWRKL